LLGDHGADVIKIEHPERGDPSRSHGYEKLGVSLWWKMLGRNKVPITLNLSTPEGGEILRRLVRDADVLIENFRPGTLERWGLGPDVLHSVNPDLVIARVTAFGQRGPYAHRPGFGTLAEAMSGFAAMTGDPEGPPMLPPFALADGVAALACVSAIVMALYRRCVSAKGGQVIDISLIEPMLTLLGPQVTVFDQLGLVPKRLGNRSENNAPRNTYLTRDGRWVALSASAGTVARRVLELVGHSEVAEEPWFASGRGRALHAVELDDCIAPWIVQRNLDEVMRAFEMAEAAVAPVYDVRDILEDPQYEALGSIATVDDADLGPLKMPNVMFRFSDTVSEIRWAGRELGAGNEEVYGERLGMNAIQLRSLKEQGVI